MTPNLARDEMTNSKSTPNDTLTKRYEFEIDLYKFYLDMSVKGSLFAFGLTGALISYYLLKPRPLAV